MKNETYVGLSRERFAAIQARVVETQRGVLGRLGLQPDELMKNTFHKLMVQGTVPGTGEPADGEAALVRSGVSSVHRGFAGFPIEGSFARLASFDGTRVDTVLLSWPKFQLHPEVTGIALATQAAVKQAILRKIEASVGADDEIALTMGVVFRAVRTLQGALVLVPAMKVVVTPLAKRVPDQSGRMLTESGLEFYAVLLKVSPRTASEDGVDLE